MHDVKDLDKESILTTLNADFYEFSISNDPSVSTSAPAKEAGGNDLPGNLDPIN